MRFVTVGRFLLRHCTVVWSNFYVYFYGNHMIGGQSDRSVCSQRAKMCIRQHDGMDTNNNNSNNNNTNTKAPLLTCELAPKQQKGWTLKYISQMQIGCGNASDLRTYSNCCVFLYTFFSTFFYTYFFFISLLAVRLIPGIYRWCWFVFAVVSLKL